MLCFYGLFLLNEREIVRGETIKQVKMLHGPYPVADLLGQISGSNAGSKLSVEILGRIYWSNSSVKLPVEIMDQIPGSNLLVKSAGQIARPCNVRRYIRNVARYIKRTPILGPPLASLGARMGAPADGPKMA
jgi:hypothetical protein